MPILGKPCMGIEQDSFMRRLCATPRHKNVQARGFYMCLSDIRHLLNHGLQTMHSWPFHKTVACHVQIMYVQLVCC